VFRSESQGRSGRRGKKCSVGLLAVGLLLAGCTDPDSCLRTTDCLVDAVCQKGKCVSVTQPRSSPGETGGEGGALGEGESSGGGTLASGEAGAMSP